jgi:small-conductance mechanosensitive channel
MGIAAPWQGAKSCVWYSGPRFRTSCAFSSRVASRSSPDRPRLCVSAAFGRAVVPAPAPTATVSETVRRVSTGIFNEFGIDNIHIFGMPLAEVLKTMPLEQAARRAAFYIAVAIISAILVHRTIQLIGTMADDFLERDPNNTRNNPVLFLACSGAVALQRPAEVLLPWLTAAFVAKVMAAFTNVAVHRLDKPVHVLTKGFVGEIIFVFSSSCAFFFLVLSIFFFFFVFSLFNLINTSQSGMHLPSHSPFYPFKPDVCAGPTATVLTWLAQAMQDLTEVVAIFGGAWFFISWKDRIVKAALESFGDQVTLEAQEDLARIVLPANTFITWAVIAIASVGSLYAFGIDVRPLLALGSVSTLAIGLASQNAVSNIVSALSTYASRSFIAGDRIRLQSLNGQLVAEGVVLKIQPLQTIIANEKGSPVYIMNKDVAALVLVNESRQKKVEAGRKVGVSNGVVQSLASAAPPVVRAELTIRYQDVELVRKVEKAVHGEIWVR